MKLSTFQFQTRPRFVYSFLAVSLLLAGVNRAEPQLERLSSPPPEQVPPAVASLLKGESFRVVEGTKVLGEFWMRAALPAQGGSSAQLGVNFGMLGLSTFAGVVRLPDQWFDYKNKPVPAGVYTLRYGQQPADGNHTGVSFYRDFFLLIPVSKDSDPQAQYGFKELNQLSSQATGTNHPAVMALFPLYDEVGATSLVKNEMEQWTVAWKVGDLTLGLVISGHGELEGY
ncbi:MAG: hypothetical protein ACE5JX_08760 [Acidobacteriota bacterium]